MSHEHQAQAVAKLMEASHHTGSTPGQKQMLTREQEATSAAAAKAPLETQVVSGGEPVKIMQQVDSSDYEDDEDGQYEEVAFEEDDDDEGEGTGNTGENPNANPRPQPAAVAKPQPATGQQQNGGVNAQSSNSGQQRRGSSLLQLAPPLNELEENVVGEEEGEEYSGQRAIE